MARKYSKASGSKVKRAMHEMKQGTLRSGRSGAKVKSRKQAIAIGLSEARRAGVAVNGFGTVCSAACDWSYRLLLSFAVAARSPVSNSASSFDATLVGVE